LECPFFRARDVPHSDSEGVAPGYDGSARRAALLAHRSTVTNLNQDLVKKGRILSVLSEQSVVNPFGVDQPEL